MTSDGLRRTLGEGGRERSESQMPERPIIIAVASYRTRSAAQSDFRALCAEAGETESGTVATALVGKSSDGQLVVDAHECNSPGPLWSSAVLGGVLTVLAPPVGLLFLVRFVGSLAVLAGVAALAGRFWNDVPQDDLRRMTEVLESSQAALVVVASNRDGTEIEHLLSHAQTTLIAKTIADLDRDFVAAATLNVAATSPQR
jgi:uncharacterized membrane protein